MEHGEKLRRLDLVGGGYDHLLPMTRIGLGVLGEAAEIFYPARLEAGLVATLNPCAMLIHYAVDEDPVHKALLEADRARVAVILMDGLAGAAVLASLADAESRGIACGYHPALPLRASAMLRAGHREEGLRQATAVEPCPEDAEAPTRLREIPPLLDAVGEWMSTKDGCRTGSEVVAFDGAKLWPVRCMTPEQLPSLCYLLPAGGRLYIISRDEQGADRPSRPALLGKGVLVTRSASQAGEFGALLYAYGATPLYFPTIEIADSWEPVQLVEALTRGSIHDGIIFTSVNAVRLFMARLVGAGLDARALAGREILVVGEKTAAALAACGLRADAVPDDYRAEGLLAILQARGISGRRYLLPRAEEARETLVTGIREQGGEVEIMTLYRTVRASPDVLELEHLHRAGMLNAVTFTSGSTFRNFMELAGPELAGAILAATPVACIGPVTAEAVREAGCTQIIMPARSTIEALTEALERHFSTAGGG